MFSDEELINQFSREMRGDRNADFDEFLECLKLLGQWILSEAD